MGQKLEMKVYFLLGVKSEGECWWHKNPFLYALNHKVRFSPFNWIEDVYLRHKKFLHNMLLGKNIVFPAFLNASHLKHSLDWQNVRLIIWKVLTHFSYVNDSRKLSLFKSTCSPDWVYWIWKINDKNINVNIKQFQIYEDWKKTSCLLWKVSFKWQVLFAKVLYKKAEIGCCS